MQVLPIGKACGRGTPTLSPDMLSQVVSRPRNDLMAWTALPDPFMGLVQKLPLSRFCNTPGIPLGSGPPTCNLLLLQQGGGMPVDAI